MTLKVRKSDLDDTKKSSSNYYRNRRDIWCFATSPGGSARCPTLAGRQPRLLHRSIRATRGHQRAIRHRLPVCRQTRLRRDHQRHRNSGYSRCRSHQRIGAARSPARLPPAGTIRSRHMQQRSRVSTHSSVRWTCRSGKRADLRSIRPRMCTIDQRGEGRRRPLRIHRRRLSGRRITPRGFCPTLPNLPCPEYAAATVPQ